MKESKYAAVLLFPDNHDPVFRTNDTDLQKRLQYMAREYHIFLKRVRSLDEAIAVTKVIKKSYQIGHMELAGHGTPFTLSWPDYTIEVGYDREKLSILFNMLESHSSILTLSCDNGRVMGTDNILDYLAKIARGHTVIGTNCENGKHLRLKISSARPFIIEYTTIDGRNVTITKKY